jgi:hypothetical protein
VTAPPDGRPPEHPNLGLWPDSPRRDQMTETATTLPTLNPEWGFFGTISRSAPTINPETAFAEAAEQIGRATDCNAEGCRNFLDSRDGRHFADMVVDKMQTEGLRLQWAIQRAIQIHQGWKIDYATSREHGIPHGLPYLTGWVAHFEIMAALAADASE